MPTEQIVSLLIQEREKINRAIEALQGPKRRGRPPKNGTGIVATPFSSETIPAKKNGRRTFTAAQRKQQAERMKAYWAKKRKAAKK